MDKPRPEADESHLIVGRKPVLETLLRDPAALETVLVQKGLVGEATDQILDACRAAGVRFRLVQRAELDGLFKGNHQGVAAVGREVRPVELEDLIGGLMDAPLPLLVALDEVQDPGNVGAIVRTLYGLGAAGLILPRHRSAHLGAGARKASAGAVDLLPIARPHNLSQAIDRLREEGLPVYCAAADDKAQNVFTARLHLPALLILGGEAKGVRPGVFKRCDTTLAIPMARDFDSLNVAQAGAILVGQFAAQAAARAKS